MNSSPKKLTLHVSFDADQVSGKLNWGFWPPSRPDDGTHAGAILMAGGEQLHLRVTGNGSVDSRFAGFDIVDCCLFTRPQVMCAGPAYPRTQFAAPSPFVGVTGASYMLPLEFSTDAPAASGHGYLSIVKHWDKTLSVSSTPGRWETSFMITVHIYRVAADAPEARVFFFDPEAEVGDGGHPSD
jgi:hypothetical protein